MAAARRSLRFDLGVQPRQEVVRGRGAGLRPPWRDDVLPRPGAAQGAPGTTYRDLFEAMGPRVSARFPDQHPQLEGARDLEVFGSRRIETMRFAPVTMRSADRVILGLGAACGLTVGSQWAVHPAGTKEVAPGAEPLGMVAVTAVQAVISEGRLVRESQPGAVQPGTRAVEESHALETRMPVEVVAPVGRDVEALLDALDGSKVLRRAEPASTPRPGSTWQRRVPRSPRDRRRRCLASSRRRPGRSSARTANS